MLRAMLSVVGLIYIVCTRIVTEVYLVNFLECQGIITEIGHCICTDVLTDVTNHPLRYTRVSLTRSERRVQFYAGCGQLQSCMRALT
jgi:hypothetical protein